MTPEEKAVVTEAAGKEAMKTYCEKNRWKVAFFEGKTGASRTGIIDAFAYRLGRKDADLIDVRLVQLMGGNAGIARRKIARLRRAAKCCAMVNWLIAEFDGDALQFLPDDPA
jgi:hypothetical protein